MNSLRRLAGPARYFSEGARRQAYTPIKKFDFQGRSSYTVLAQPQRSDSEKGMGIKAIPYEIKESTFKNALGVFMGECFEFMLPAASGIGPVVMLGFALNYFYRMSLYLGRTVVQVDMQSNGSAVTFKTLLGQEHSFDLENVLKMKDEKALVEGFTATVSLTADQSQVLRAGELAKIRVGSVGKTVGEHLYGKLERWLRRKIDPTAQI